MVETLWPSSDRKDNSSLFIDASQTTSNPPSTRHRGASMAIDAPRWRVEGGLDVVCEASMNNELLSFLSELGHNVSTKSSDDAFGFGGAQLIRRLPNGFYIGGSESRKDGHVIGY